MPAVPIIFNDSSVTTYISGFLNISSRYNLLLTCKQIHKMQPNFEKKEVVCNYLGINSEDLFLGAKTAIRVIKSAEKTSIFKTMGGDAKGFLSGLSSSQSDAEFHIACQQSITLAEIALTTPSLKEKLPANEVEVKSSLQKIKYVASSFKQGFFYPRKQILLFDCSLSDLYFTLFNLQESFLEKSTECAKLFACYLGNLVLLIPNYIISPLIFGISEAHSASETDTIAEKVIKYQQSKNRPT